MVIVGFPCATADWGTKGNWERSAATKTAWFFIPPRYSRKEFVDDVFRHPQPRGEQSRITLAPAAPLAILGSRDVRCDVLQRTAPTSCAPISTFLRRATRCTTKKRTMGFLNKKQHAPHSLGGFALISTSWLHARPCHLNGPTGFTRRLRLAMEPRYQPRGFAPN